MKIKDVGTAVVCGCAGGGAGVLARRRKTEGSVLGPGREQPLYNNSGRHCNSAFFWFTAFEDGNVHSRPAAPVTGFSDSSVALQAQKTCRICGKNASRL